jgi:hypothetical protein
MKTYENRPCDACKQPPRDHRIDQPTLTVVLPDRSYTVPAHGYKFSGESRKA